MTTKQEFDKKFPIWGAWMGVGIAVLAIVLLMTMHTAFRSLILVGSIAAVIVAITRWKITPAAQRTAWLLIPAIIGPVLLGIFLYLRYDYLPKALETQYEESISQEYQFDDIDEYEDGSHPRLDGE